MGGRPRIVIDSQIGNARRLIEGGETVAQASLDQVRIRCRIRAAFALLSRIGTRYLEATGPNGNSPWEAGANMTTGGSGLGKLTDRV